MERLTLAEVEVAVETMADLALANEQRYCDLDGAAGDGDFGTSLADGFRAVKAGWADLDRTDIGTFLRGISLIISSKMGGSSGPIWGTGFLRAGLKAKGKDALTVDDLAVMYRSALEGIMKRGGARIGDKTLVDALAPATERLEAHAADGRTDVLTAYTDAAQAAHDAIEGTRGLIAMRGRASFTGERSRGTVDPGIVAVAEMMQAVTAAVQKHTAAAG